MTAFAETAPAPVAVPVRAAGAVLWRDDPDGPLVALVHRPRYDDWSLPKGKVDPGEHPLATAVREVREETGWQGVLGRALGELHYEMSGGRGPKTVHYWAMRATAGHFEPNEEVDELRWLPLPAACAQLSYPHDEQVLDRFAAAPVDTSPLLLVRHAHAGSRGDWTGDDRDRPLSERGRADAQAMVAPLCGFSPAAVFAADLTRCVQTLFPTAQALGLPVTTDPALSEETYDADPRASRERLREFVHAGTGVLLCSQGGAIPGLVSWLADADDVGLGEPVKARKGSVWALAVAGRRIVAADYYPHLRPD